MTVKPESPRVVLSASRRTDLVRWYPEALRSVLAVRYPPTRVHTIVILTKFPAAILDPPLAEALSQYDQCQAQITVTGWGGSAIEPHVPRADAVVAELPRLIAFLGDVRRLRLRLDPLLRLADGRDNLGATRGIMAKAASYGISDFITSVVTPYNKIVPRLAAAGLVLAPLSGEERREIIGSLGETAATLGVKLSGCCVPELPPAACIDGRILQELHPAGLPCRLDHPSGQRSMCGCTHAIDLGWYASHPCYSGCLYCYANPKPYPR